MRVIHPIPPDTPSPTGMAAGPRSGGRGGAIAAVRRFTPDHITDVVRLRRAMFRTSERPDDHALAAYYERVFFKNPWYDPSMPSLVVEESGRTVGFIGVIPRPFTYRGQTIKGAASTEFMVHPDAQRHVPLLLLRAFLQSGQDISFADRANERARLLLEAAGGSTALWFSFYWSVPVRPLRHALAQAPAWAALRPMLAAARHAAALFDRLPSYRSEWRGIGIEPLAVDDVVSALPHALAGRCDLYPQYDGASFAWLLERLAEKTSLGTLDAFQLREGQHLAGWCVMLVRDGGRAEIVHWGARQGRYEVLLDAAVRRARDGGAITLAGRLDPLSAPSLADLRAPFTLGAPLTVVHARRPELLHAISQGRAFFSRLDGEWWLST